MVAPDTVERQRRDWKYSSARNFQEDQTILKIDETGFLG